MNRLSVPIGILVVILIALGAWAYVAHRQNASTPPLATGTATTTQPGVTLPTTTTAAPSYPDEDMVASNIAGVWQSTDDQNYSIDVTSNGKWTDTYAGSDASSAKETGTYQLFTSDHPDKSFTGVLVPGVVYLSVTEGGLTLYYSVLEDNATNLQISYLDRGTTLSFVRRQ